MADIFGDYRKPGEVPLRRIKHDLTIAPQKRNAWEELLGASKKATDYVKLAPDKIAQLSGYVDYDQLKSAAMTASQLIPQFQPAICNDSDREKRTKFLEGNMLTTLCWSQYSADLHTFASIHATFKALAAGRGDGWRGLEIGCNFAPYSYYLRNDHGVDMHGLDKNRFAVKYARSNGFPLAFGDARKMRYPSGTFDMVISNHFLCSEYILPFIPDWNTHSFICHTIKETERVLKPGGYFLSFQEDPFDDSFMKGFDGCEEYDYGDIFGGVFAYHKAGA